MQPLNQGRHFRKSVLAHLVEPTVKSRDQLFLARVYCLKTMRRRSRVAAMILRRMPFARGYVGEEALHFRGVRKQLAIEVPGVPIDQDSAEIEYGNGGV